MRNIILAAVVGVTTATAAERELKLSFDSTLLGKTPTNFTSAISGLGKPGRWEVIAVEAPSRFPSVTGKSTETSSQRVLAQLSREPIDEHFPLLIYEGETFHDFTFAAKVRMVGGGLEQMAGLAFRIQDAQNYYVVRANALNGNLRFYKFVNGQRSEPIGPAVPLKLNEWYDLEVRCRGNAINIFINGQQPIPELTDTSFRAGKVGFWTKSDSESQFTAAVVRYTPTEILAITMVSKAHKDFQQLRGIKLFSRPDTDANLRVVAANPAESVGQPADSSVEDCFKTGRFYKGKAGNDATVTVPLRDKNGDVAAVLEVRLKTFFGQTQASLLERAMVVARSMESQFLTRQQLFE